MIEELYRREILAHARAAVGAGHLPIPPEDGHGEATVDNPLCGDRVTVQVTLDGGLVVRLAHRVRGCVLCEAAASVLGHRAPGLTPTALRDAAAAFAAMLRAGGPVPEGWPELAAFSPVRETRTRHECVLLPFTAAEQALDAAEETPADA